MSIQDEIKKRRTFAIISHPDAGKTTITEQLLYFGGEIREAGTVKGKKTGNFAKSDWMDNEIGQVGDGLGKLFVFLTAQGVQNQSQDDGQREASDQAVDGEN